MGKYVGKIISDMFDIWIMKSKMYLHLWTSIKNSHTNRFANICIMYEGVPNPQMYLNIHMPRHRHTQTSKHMHTVSTCRLTCNACTLTFRQIYSRLLQLFLSFTLFCSHLRGIISLSNPFPYIKWCFLLRLAPSAQCTSCWQRRCFPQKTPSRSRQGNGKERETDPSGTSWKISSFFVSPLKKTGFFFSFCLGNVIEQNKQVVLPCLPLELSYFERRIRWGSFAYVLRILVWCVHSSRVWWGRKTRCLPTI